jgi:hypothetical protein
MNSLTDLREVVDVVIGVATHVHTHCAAVVDAATGGVLDEITVEAPAEGYPSWWSSLTATGYCADGTWFRSGRRLDRTVMRHIRRR